MFSSSPDLQEFLLIEAACRRLTLVYARGIDLYDDDMVLAAFARDGIWNRPGNPPLRGHPEIAEFLKSRDRAILMRHVMSNFQLELLGASRATFSCAGLVGRLAAVLRRPGEGPLFRERGRLK